MKTILELWRQWLSSFRYYLTPREAERTPEKSINNITSDATEESGAINILECPVCLRSCLQPVQLPCKHIFCYLCIKGAILSLEVKRCSMCRQDIPPTYLENIRLTASQLPTLTFEDSYQWFYQGLDGWWQYDDRTGTEIEAAYKKGDKKCEMLIAAFVYVIDFQRNLQFRKRDPSRLRSIKRDLATIAKKGVSGIRIDKDVKPVDKKNTRNLSPSKKENSLDSGISRYSTTSVIPNKRISGIRNVKDVKTVVKKDARNVSSSSRKKNSQDSVISRYSTRSVTALRKQNKVTRSGRAVKLPTKFKDYYLN